MLSDGERPVAELPEEIAVTPVTVSGHLAMLRHGGFVESRWQAQRKFYRLTEKGETLVALVKTLAAL
jgi:DNA-binding transcriptional ArsR family regulator